MKIKRDREAWLQHCDTRREQPHITFSPILFDVIYWPGREVYFAGSSEYVFQRKDLSMFTDDDKAKMEEELRLIDEAEERFRRGEMECIPVGEFFFGGEEPVPDGYPDGYDLETGFLTLRRGDRGIERETLNVPLPNGRTYEVIQPVKFMRGVQPLVGEHCLRLLSLVDYVPECWPVKKYDIVEMPKPYQLAREVVPEDMFLNIPLPGRIAYDDDVYVTGKVVDRK